jgi:hypothetical protein
MTLRSTCALAVVLCGLAAARAGSAVTAEGLALPDVQLTGQGVRTAEGKTLPLTAIWQVDLAPADRLDRQPGATILTLRDGSALRCESIRLAEGTFRIAHDVLGELAVPIDQAQRIVFAPARRDAADVLATCRERSIGPGSRDVLAVAVNESKWQSVAGVLVAMGESKITFRYRDKDRTVDREKVRAIWLAETDRTAPAGDIMAGLRDGSRVRCTGVRAEGETINLTSPVLGELTCPADELARLRMNSDRLIDLAERKPEKVLERGFFNVTFPHRIDRSVAGGPLQMVGKQYATGLGLHSYAELTWNLPEPCELLVFTAGIDDAARPNGQAELTVLMGEKVLAGPVELTGQDEPKRIRANLTGATSVTIRVDFGADRLGTGDHVDIVEARLVKPAPATQP